MKQHVRKVEIVGTGSYVPEKIYTNQYLESIIDTKSSWIESNLGIKERRIADDKQATSDLAVIAAERAILNAGLTAKDIDLIIVATATPDRQAPSTACFVQNKLEGCSAVAFDISAVCSGFLFGMSVGCQYVCSGVYNNVLVIGADTFSNIVDWKRRDAVFFGDGAGAIVLSHADTESGFLSFKLYSDGAGAEKFTIPAGGSENPASKATLDENLHTFRMDGHAVYETATRVLPEAIKEVLMASELTVDDIDYMIPHQPSIGILKKTASLIGLPFDKVMTNMDKYANTSGGTIPILLDEVHRDGKLISGTTVLFAAVGSGWTYGAAILRWP